MANKKGNRKNRTRRLRRTHERLMWAGLRFGFKVGGTLFPALTTRFAYRLWLKTRRFTTPLRELCYEETATLEYLNHAGLPLATYRWGEGPKVLLAHGWSGRATQLHAFVDPLLQAGYQVIAMDAPAHGRTPGKQTNVLEYVAALARVQHRFGPFSGTIAHSFGNPAVMLAMQEGVLSTTHVVAISPPSTLLGMLYKFSAMFDLPAPVTDRLRSRVEHEFGADIWQRMSVEAVAPKLRTPALVIHDENDTDVPIEEGETTAAYWPNAKIMRTKGLGHTRILRAGAVIDAAVAFIDDMDVDVGDSIDSDTHNFSQNEAPARTVVSAVNKSSDLEPWAKKFFGLRKLCPYYKK